MFKGESAKLILDNFSEYELTIIFFENNSNFFGKESGFFTFIFFKFKYFLISFKF